MAGNLLLFVHRGQQTPYEDGDIVVAKNREEIRFAHAQRICHKSAHGFNTNGLRNNDTLLERFLDATSRYKFTRVSENEVLRHDRLTDTIELCYPGHANPDLHMRPVHHLRWLMRSSKHLVFGEPGSEVWYGGGDQMDAAGLDVAWGHIEDRTALRQVDHPHFPFTDGELREFYALPVEDFSHQEGADMVAPLVDHIDEGGRDLRREILKMRQHQVDWRALSAQRRVQEVLNRNTRVDARDTEPIRTRQSIVIVKPDTRVGVRS